MEYLSRDITIECPVSGPYVLENIVFFVGKIFPVCQW